MRDDEAKRLERDLREARAEARGLLDDRARIASDLDGIRKALVTFVGLMESSSRAGAESIEQVKKLVKSVDRLHALVAALHEASPMDDLLEVVSDLMEALSEQVESDSSDPARLSGTIVPSASPSSPIQEQTPLPPSSPPGRAERILTLVSDPKRGRILLWLLGGCALLGAVCAGLLLALLLNGDVALRLLIAVWRLAGSG